MTIYFYSTREQYGCFSNFSPHGFELDGVYWPTSEHYFQAQKFAGTSHADQIRGQKMAKDAANMGRDRQRPLRSDWHQVKDEMMRKAVLRKFETHSDIREILLSTGDEEIIENSPIDYYWGCGADGSGKNMLGIILMEVREILRDRSDNHKLAQLQRIAISPSQFQNNRIFLTSEQLHYLSRVLRLQKGDRFIAMNGQGEWWLAKLEGEQAEIINSINVQTELAFPVNLMVALPKGNGFDEVVRQATALGVACIIPIISDRTLLNPSPQKLERWRRIAAEASEQSERQIVPTIFDPIPFSTALSLIGEIKSPSSSKSLNSHPLFLNFLSENDQLYICVARGNYPHLLTFLLASAPSRQRPSDPVTIAIGPEGGWTDAEIEQACATFFQPVSLGRRILTTVLAPIVALSVLAGVIEVGTINNKE